MNAVHAMVPQIRLHGMDASFQAGQYFKSSSKLRYVFTAVKGATETGIFLYVVEHKCKKVLYGMRTFGSKRLSFYIQ